MRKWRSHFLVVTLLQLQVVLYTLSKDQIMQIPGECMSVVSRTTDFIASNATLSWHTHIYIHCIYKVAQIKIPHRTICNFSTTVWDFYTQMSWFIWRDPATILNFFKNHFSFLQSYGCINILYHIFNFARNNQQQLVIFIVKKHWLLLQIPKSDK